MVKLVVLVLVAWVSFGGSVLRTHRRLVLKLSKSGSGVWAPFPLIRVGLPRVQGWLYGVSFCLPPTLKVLNTVTRDLHLGGGECIYG